MKQSALFVALTKKSSVPWPPEWLATPLLVFAVTRLGFWLVGFGSSVYLPLDRVEGAVPYLPGNYMLDGWLRWDAIGYLALAQEGYWYDAITGYGSAPVLPLFPLLVRLLAALVGQPWLAALIVGNAVFAASLVVMYALVSKLVGRTVATRAIVLFCVTPLALLFVAPYPHSLAVLLALATLVALDRNRPWRATGFASLAALTFPAGLALWPVVVFGQAKRGWRSATLALLAMAVPLVAFVGYVTFSVGLPPAHVREMVLGPQFIGSLIADPTQAHLTGGTAGSRVLLIGSLVFGLVLLASTSAVARSLGRPYALYSAGTIFFGIVLDPGDLGQYLLLAWPPLVVIARFLRSEGAELLLIGVSALFAALLTACFVSWYPVSADAASPWHANKPARISAWYRTLGATPANPLDLTVADDLLLLGYGPLGGLSRPGDTMPISVYVHRLRASEQHYLLSANLTDEHGNRWATTQQSLPAQESTPRLDQGDRARLDLGLEIDSLAPAGVYYLSLNVLVVPPFSTEYESPAITDLSGQPVEQIDAGEVIVGDSSQIMHVDEARPRVATHATFGEEVVLLGYDLSQPRGEAGEAIEVALYWTAAKQPSFDYSVFVQVLDSDGEILVQADGYPLEGRFPMSHLSQAVAVRDTRTLTLANGNRREPLQIVVGLYSLDTLKRLDVQRQDGGEVMDYLPLAQVSWPIER